MEKKHYGAVDGLQMLASVGIVMMHIRSNMKYQEVYIARLSHHLRTLCSCL